MAQLFERPNRAREAGVLLLLGLCLMILIFWPEFKAGITGMCETWLASDLCHNEDLRSAVGGTLWGAAFLPLVMYVQYLYPAKDQPLISVGLIQDFIWYLVLRIYKVTLLVWFAAVLFTFFDTYLYFLRIGWLDQLAVPVQVVLVVLCVDLLAWFRHWLHHKIPLLWEFHKFHHAQREMNFFCEIRVHPLESISARLIELIPFYSLGLDVGLPSYAAYSILTRWQGHLVHSNVRGTFGWLRYVFVNPQSHRIHHSNEQQHQDKNFATIFSFWDFLFRTQHLNFNEYPDTGVDDASYPYSNDVSVSGLVKSTVAELLYPIVRIAHGRGAVARRTG
jgi:sterol desaturase/sphingolipid hydroxylase (fatty acid hydroxylase superfamily)